MIRMEVSLTAGATLTLEKKALRRTMRQAGGEVAKEARSLIKQTSGGGKLYYISGGSYRASAAGSAPVKVTGALLRGIKVRVFKSGQGVAIRDTAFYAVMLEAGAKGGGRRGGKGVRNKRGLACTARVLAPRPFLSVALAKTQADIGPRIRAAIVEGIAFRKDRVKRVRP